jgi:hypothetical protein
MSVRILKMRGTCCLAEELLAFQGLHSKQLTLVQGKGKGHP